MARSRNIKPGLFTNEELVECSFAARYLFVGLWTEADCYGRLENRPKRLKMALLPADDVDIVSLLQELADHGFLEYYGNCGEPTDASQPYIWIVNFEKHQHPHKKELEGGSKLPFPKKRPGQDPDKTGTTPGQDPVEHHASPADTRYPIPDSRYPIPENQGQPSDRPVHTHSKKTNPSGPRKVGDILGTNGTASKPRTQAVIDDILAATREPPERYGPYWLEVGKRLQAVEAAHVLLDGIKHLKAHQDIRSPGAWLNAQCRDELKAHGKSMPKKP
jgi:hypothetical protein